MVRIPLHYYLLQLAQVAAQRGTCSKRQVGAVIADFDNRIVTVNYNGSPPGQDHCIDRPCKALTMAAPGSHLACRAVHAEANALIVAGLRTRGGTMACTTSPCYECAKLIAAAGIKTLVVGQINRLFYDDTSYSETPKTLLGLASVRLVFLPESFTWLPKTTNEQLK